MYVVLNVTSNSVVEFVIRLFCVFVTINISKKGNSCIIKKKKIYLKQKTYRYTCIILYIYAHQMSSIREFDG